jgi:hypothetical protein
VGPLAAGTGDNHDALVMTLVDFCLSSLPATEGASAWSP